MSNDGASAPVFDMDRIAELRRELKKFDAMDLSKCRFLLSGKDVTPTAQELEQFAYMGLNNSDFAAVYREMLLGANDE